MKDKYKDREKTRHVYRYTDRQIDEQLNMGYGKHYATLSNFSSVMIFLRPCDPKAPRATAVNPNKAPIRMDRLVIAGITGIARND